MKQEPKPKTQVAYILRRDLYFHMCLDCTHMLGWTEIDNDPTMNPAVSFVRVSCDRKTCTEVYRVR